LPEYCRKLVRLRCRALIRHAHWRHLANAAIRGSATRVSDIAVPKLLWDFLSFSVLEIEF